MGKTTLEKKEKKLNEVRDKLKTLRNGENRAGKKGVLKVEGRYSLRKKASVFNLHGSMLSYVNSKGNTKKIPVQDVTICDSGIGTNTFKLRTTQGRRYSLTAIDPKQKFEWIHAIEQNKRESNPVTMDKAVIDMMNELCNLGHSYRPTKAELEKK